MRASNASGPVAVSSRNCFKNRRVCRIRKGIKPDTEPAVSISIRLNAFDSTGGSEHFSENVRDNKSAFSFGLSPSAIDLL